MLGIIDLEALPRQTSDQQHPLQSAYRHNRNVQDTVVVLLKCVFEQLEKPKSYVRIPFADPTSAFTLSRPTSLPERSWTYNNLSRAITLWIVSFPTERKQRARVCTDDAISAWTATPTGAPQSCVLPPVDCSGSQTEYDIEAQNFFSWCTCSDHNVSKTKELVTDVRLSPSQL